jgi:hypothetical protein
MKRGFAFLPIVAALAAITVFTVAPGASAAPPKAALTTPIPVSGTPTGGGSFTGTLSQIQFVNQRGQLTVQGLLNGTLTTATQTLAVVNQAVSLPVGAAAASNTCTILELTIQPIDLNLLGLMVHTDTIHLLITAQQGGGLLGDLLCGLDNALNGGGGGLAGLLNRLLGL